MVLLNVVEGFSLLDLFIFMIEIEQEILDVELYAVEIYHM